jgi:hypothetical protein
MEENVRKELETLENMVLNWKRSYLGSATPEGGDEFLAEEFSEEISRHVSPYVRRLYENDHLTLPEAQGFLDLCQDHVEDLLKSLIEGSGNHNK